jgi:hypothetical protein
MMSMYYKTEMLFPPRVIHRLRDLRGEMWQKLVDRVSSLPEMHPDRLAFMLMMIRLDGCLNCDADSYRAMRGCELCARQTVRRFKGTDKELLNLFEQAQQEVGAYLESRDIGLKKAA